MMLQEVGGLEIEVAVSRFLGSGMNLDQLNENLVMISQISYIQH